MKLTRILVIPLALLAAAALAGEEKSEQIKVFVSTDDGSGPVEIKIDSDTTGFSLDDLTDGESRTIVDEGGQTVIIKRIDDSYEFTVDGKTIDLPAPQDAHHGNGMQHVFVTRTDIEDNAAGQKEVNVRVLRLHEDDAAEGPDDILIFSGQPLGDSVREEIRSVLEKSGHEGGVNFIDRSDKGDETGEWHSADGKRIKVIKRKVEAS